MSDNTKGAWPIIETIAEFHFDQSSPWDGAIPGLMFRAIEEEFPHRKQRRLISNNLKQEGNDIRQEVQIVERLQFFNNDNNTLIQVNQHLLTVNRLKPYTNWEEFSPKIQKALNTYVENAEPKGLKRVSLRFINEIELGEGTHDLSKYFQFYPFVGPDLSPDIYRYSCNIEQQVAELPGTLTIQVATKEPRTDDLNVILNLEISTEQATIQNSVDWLQDAHKILNTTFKGCITKELYNQYTSGKSE